MKLARKMLTYRGMMRYFYALFAPTLNKGRGKIRITILVGASLVTLIGITTLLCVNSFSAFDPQSTTFHE
jgi:hypothetical protein